MFINWFRLIFNIFHTNILQKFTLLVYYLDFQFYSIYSNKCRRDYKREISDRCCA